MISTGSTRPAPFLNPSGSDEFSRLGLGTGMLASLRGGLSFLEANRLVGTARDHGINLIDTADSYASGECERLLGRILGNYPGAFQLITKAGYATSDLPPPLHRLNPIIKKIQHRYGRRQNFDPTYLQRALAKSLKRLRSDHVDVFLLHDPSPTDLLDGEVFALLDDLKKKGMTRMVGISSGENDSLTSALEWSGCEVIQTPLMTHGGLAPALLTQQAQKVKIILNHVSLGGRLPGNDEDLEPEILTLRSRIAARANELGTSKQAALLAVALEITGAASVLTGTRSVEHLIENARAIR